MDDRITLPAETERCIQEQIDWFEEESHGGADLADRWLKQLRQAIHKLADDPRSQGFAPENHRWQPDLELRQNRFRPWEKKPGWRILYVVDSDPPTVTVVQIRHERRSLLREEKGDNDV